MTEKESLTTIQSELLKAADYIADTALLFTAPCYSDIHPEMSGIYSAAIAVIELAESITETEVAE